MAIEKMYKNDSVQQSAEKRRKFMLYLAEVILSLGMIGILVPIIVDISINKQLTWSLISTISIIYAYSGLITLYLSKESKWMKTLLTYSVLLIPYLFLLETVIAHQYLTSSQNRFMEYALPISCLWLAILWGVILFAKITKLNIFYAISILFLLAIVGSSVTNAIACKIRWIKTFDEFDQKIQVLEFIACATFFFFLGTFRKVNRKAGI
ncbi:MAG: hypothetical protein PUC65_03740 [Clostridiales bacterium]|nr:hypothetical protein [Clostridiales bacterium]